MARLAEGPGRIVVDEDSGQQKHSIAGLFPHVAYYPGMVLEVSVTKEPTNGYAFADATSVTFLPSPDADFESTGELTMTVDGEVFSVSPFTFEIVPVPDAPYAAPDEAVLEVGAAYVIIDPLANDSDADGDRLRLVEVLDADNVTVLDNGKLRFNRAGADGSPDTFSYRIEDETGLSATGTVSVMIRSGGTSGPVAMDDTAVAKNIKAITKGLKIDVLKNDTSTAGKKGLDKKSLEIVDGPDHGSASVVKGKIVYRADDGFDGQDGLTYRVADKSGSWSDLATVVISGPDLSAG